MISNAWIDPKEKKEPKRIGGATGGEFLHEEIPDSTPNFCVGGVHRDTRISWDHSSSCP